MKIKLHHILILSMALLALVNTALAQDAGLVDVEINDSERDRLDREKIISSPGEADVRYIPRSTTSKDTLVSNSSATPAQSKFKAEKPAPMPKNTVQKQSKNESEEEDDSILGFNFLYYIIQKYKLQDIVD